MCGICGQFNGAPQGLRERLQAMCAAMAYRGPDDEGMVLEGGSGLGHRRLSVIDLETGHQPLASADGTIQAVVNGEFYNFRELRRTLEQEGAVFRTRSDSEVLVHLYASMRREWDRAAPERLLSRLDGMFALALWDRSAGRLLLARDRIGQKPLFYAQPRPGYLVFASELQALQQGLPGSLTRDPDAIWHYFKYGYIPAPLSLYQEIRKLPAAHYLLADGDGVHVARYWSLPDPEDVLSGSPEALVEQFTGLLSEAVRQRLVADVPVGAFLSGGVDSAYVCALMRRHGPVQSFTVGFADASYDERSGAQAVAASLGTTHAAQEVTIDVRALLPRLTAHFGEPFGDSSAVNLWYLAGMTREQVTVALSGDGADELLAGYRRYRGRVLTGRYLHLPRCLRRGVINPCVRALPDPGGYYGDSWVKKAKLLVDQAERLDRDSLAVASAAFQDDGLADLLPDVRPSDDLVRSRAAAWQRCDPVNQMLRTDIETYLADDILVKVDRMSMAHGLEARSPFLDHRVVEFACRLPLALKLCSGTCKVILRRAAAALLPPAVLHRPKHGFMLPLDRWLRAELREPAQAATSSLASDGFAPVAIARLWDEHVSGQQDHSHRLWLLWMWGLSTR